MYYLFIFSIDVKVEHHKKYTIKSQQPIQRRKKKYSKNYIAVLESPESLVCTHEDISILCR